MAYSIFESETIFSILSLLTYVKINGAIKNEEILNIRIEWEIIRIILLK
jgi:hypothetical protein